MVENIKPFLVNDPYLLRQTYHCLELFVQQTTKNFLSIVLQRICALFKTEMSSLHVPRLMPQCILRIIHATLIFMPTTFRAWNLNENVNKVSAARRPYFSYQLGPQTIRRRVCNVLFNCLDVAQRHRPLQL